MPESAHGDGGEEDRPDDRSVVTGSGTTGERRGRAFGMTGELPETSREQEWIGGDDGIRTHDLLSAIQALFRAGGRRGRGRRGQSPPLLLALPLSEIALCPERIGENGTVPFWLAPVSFAGLHCAGSGSVKLFQRKRAPHGQSSRFRIASCHLAGELSFDRRKPKFAW